MPSASVISKLNIDAQAAYDAGQYNEAVNLWIQTLQLYPTCSQNALHHRTKHVFHALNALERVRGKTDAPCDDPALKAARLAREAQAELTGLINPTLRLKKDREALEQRIREQSSAAHDAATFLDAAEPPPSTTSIVERHDRAVATFGRCPEFRAALARYTLAALPAKTQAPPSCDPDSDKARDALRQAMSAMERAEPGAATRSSADYTTLSQRLATLEGEGPELSAKRAQATSADNQPDHAAAAWATIARELPTCAAYLASKHDAAIAAVTAWQGPGPHGVAADGRYSLSTHLLEAVMTAIETDHGAQAALLREHQSLTMARSELRPSSTPTRPLLPVAVQSKPVARTTPEIKERWIYRHRPERNLIELGAFGGVIAPASGLLDGGEGSHQLFAASTTVYQRYRPVAPEIGLRVTWLPLSFLGGEIEGGVMPTRVIDNDVTGDRATLFNFRGHLVGQLPFWRITPFILVGGGMLGTTGALGKDVDPTLTLGGGMKFHVSRHLVVRLDLRENRAPRSPVGTGGTDYPEVLLGLSWTLNRRPVGAKKSSTPRKEPRP